MAAAVPRPGEVTARVDQVIVPLDRSSRAEAAVPVGRAFAAAFHAGLHLVHVTWDHDPAECEAYLGSVAGALGDEHVATSVLHGWPVPAIAELAGALGDEVLVCLAAHARTGAGAVLLGSVADELLGAVTAPMAVIGPQVEPSSVPPGLAGATVLVCSDGSDVSASIAPLVVEWAGALDLDVQVVMVLHRDGTFLGNVDATRPKAGAHQLVDQLASAGVRAELVLLDGLDPARAIAAHAAAVGAGFVVTSTHGAGGGPLRAVLGSVALRTVRHSPCPVVLRRPPPVV